MNLAGGLVIVGSIIATLILVVIIAMKNFYNKNKHNEG